MQTRGVKTLDFAGTKEEVYERNDWPREKFQVRAASCSLLTVGILQERHSRSYRIRISRVYTSEHCADLDMDKD
jgi:ketol-acid reductoisomerase